jgi:hypothetical protein
MVKEEHIQRHYVKPPLRGPPSSHTKTFYAFAPSTVDASKTTFCTFIESKRS